MLPAEVPHTYSIAVPLRIVLWQHVGDLRPLSGSSKDSGQLMPGLERGTLSWYARPLAIRSPPLHMWNTYTN